MDRMTIPVAFLVSLLFARSPAESASGGGLALSDPPIKVSVAVSPTAVGPGADAVVTVKLDPKPGIKLNKYPKIKLQIPAVPGLVDAAEQLLGNPAPPPADQMDSNYFHGGVDPLTITLHVNPQATKGRHDVRAKLSYFYCVAASGYCAPAKVELTVPVIVR